MSKNEIKIRSLIDRFMQGKTSIEEEQQLSQWFATHHDVSDDLKDYQSMFAYFDEGMPLEGQAADAEPERMPKTSQSNHIRIRPLWTLMAAAASIALLIGLIAPRLKQEGSTTSTTPLAYANDSEKAKQANEPTDTTTQETSITNPKMEKSKAQPVRRNRMYRKHLFAPAPPTSWVAEANIDSLATNNDIMAEAHLQTLKDEQNEMLFKLYLTSALQSQQLDVASYTDEDGNIYYSSNNQEETSY